MAKEKAKKLVENVKVDSTPSTVGWLMFALDTMVCESERPDMPLEEYIDLNKEIHFMNNVIKRIKSFYISKGANNG